MTYETKVVLRLLADQIVEADDVEEAYEAVVNAATAEGMEMPDYNEARAKKMKKRQKTNA